MSTDGDTLARVAASPRYRSLVRRRGRFAATLASIMISAYLGFILLVAFAPGILSRPIAGGATTLGIPVGLGLILLAILLTGIYVMRANRDFDGEVATIVRDAAL